jgi:hypothetical protein
MSESWSEIGRHDDESAQAGTAWSANGKGVPDAPEAMIADADQAAEAGGSPPTSIAVDEPEVETTSAADSGADLAPVPEVDQPRSFLGELARAMQATAGQERERLVGDTDRRRSARIDEIRAREKAEADRMRELAAEDQSAIDSWAETEIARIKAEQDRRAEALGADLETSLGQHRELIAQEIDRVETAVATYRSEIETFFDALERETDPVAIAHLATKRPVFPSLDTVPLTADEAVAPAATTIAAEPVSEEPVTVPEAIAEEAPPAAALASVSDASPEDQPASETVELEPAVEPTVESTVAEATEDAVEAAAREPATEDEAPVAAIPGAKRPLVGVLDYSPDPFGDPWRDLPEKSGEPTAQEAEVEATASAVPESAKDEATSAMEIEDAASAAPSRGRSVLQAVPALRPMGSWLGRHANSDRPDLPG